MKLSLLLSSALLIAAANAPAAESSSKPSMQATLSAFANDDVSNPVNLADVIFTIFYYGLSENSDTTTPLDINSINIVSGSAEDTDPLPVTSFVP